MPGQREGWRGLLEAIWHNVLTSRRANFVEVPTDCPQRDERLGWMADAHLSALLAAFNYDISGFMSKWLEDVLDAWTASGHFTDVVPRPSGRTTFRNREGAPARADAGALLPWALYQLAHFGSYAPVGRIEVGWSWSGDDEVTGELVVPARAAAAVASEIVIDGRRAKAVGPGA